MATIVPFRGVTYNSAALGAPLGEVLAEPYDKIDETLRKKYLARHALNCVRLILGKDDDPLDERDKDLAKLAAYPRARALMDRWLERGVLMRAEKPCLYVLIQKFQNHGQDAFRFGVIGRVAVDKDDVKFHERTFAGPKGDRRQLLDATDADFDQVFFLAEDPEKRIVAALDPYADRAGQWVARPEPGREDHLHAVDDPKKIKELQDLLASRDVTIADGHHRFEMTRERFLERKNAKTAREADRFRTAAIFATSDPGLTILPTHRLVKLPAGLAPSDLAKRLEERVDIFECADTAERTVGYLFEGLGCPRGSVGLVVRGDTRCWMLQPRKNAETTKALEKLPEPIRGLEVSWLHALVLDPLIGEAKHDVGDKIGYLRGARAGLARLESGEYDALFMLPATEVQDVVRCGKAGARMPQKSTDFYPKLLSGLVTDDKRA